jgi:hypothetical protein
MYTQKTNSKGELVLAADLSGEADEDSSKELEEPLSS